MIKCRYGDARGLEVSPCGLGQNQFVQSQIRNGSPQTFILLLKTLQFFELRGSHSSVLLTPTVKGLLCDLDFPDCINTRQPLTDKHLNLT